MNGALYSLIARVHHHVWPGWRIRFVIHTALLARMAETRPREEAKNRVLTQISMSKCSLLFRTAAACHLSELLVIWASKERPNSSFFESFLSKLELRTRALDTTFDKRSLRLTRNGL
jgi:hypothetical protein